MPTLASAETPLRRVGVVVTHQVNLDDELASELASALGEAIAAALPVDVVAGRDATRNLPPGGIPDSCIADEPCRQDVGRRLDADELLLLAIVRIGDTTQIDSTWVDMTSGQINARPAIQLDGKADRGAVFGDAVARLLPHIARRKADSQPRVVVVTQGPAPERKIPRSALLPVWIAAGVGVASLAAGTGFALSARHKHDVLAREGCRDGDCPASEIASLDRHALAADIFLATAAVSAGVAVLFYLRGRNLAEETPAGPDSKASAATPRAAITVAPDLVGVTLGGRF